MKSIKENIKDEYIINKSRFITEFIKINNPNEVDNCIKAIKNKYKDATHYCYAYIVSNTKRFNDDGEPGGTAGMPILNVLENNDLTNVLCVVIRYFGGIKLGAGGLVRAYTKSVTNCLDKAFITNLEKGYKILIDFNYDNIKNIDNILKDNVILNKSFDETITYEFLILESDFKNINDNLKFLVNKLDVKENMLINT